MTCAIIDCCHYIGFFLVSRSGVQLLGQEELHALTDALALLDLPGTDKMSLA